MEPDQQSKAEKDKNNHNESATIPDVTPTQQNDCEEKKAVKCDNDMKNDSEEIIKEDFENILPVNNIIKSNVDSAESTKSEKSQSLHSKSSIECAVKIKNSSDCSEDGAKEPIKQTNVPLENPQTKEKDKSNNGHNDNIDLVDSDQKKSNDECAEKKNTVVVSASSSNEVSVNVGSTDAQENLVGEVDMTTVKDGEMRPNNLPSFPGTVTKPVAGSNDVKIEIASSSLFDRVILYSLKNKVVDNSRLDAAKNKYLINNGQASSTSLNNNSNESDSNSSSKSVDKLIEEFKGSCKSITSSETKKSDSNNENISNGAENKLVNNSEQKEGIVDIKVENIKETTQSVAQNEQKNSENEALDFRDKNSDSYKVSTDTTMLDLSVKRDEKSVPPIKRSHALYVGIPDFSKQIFTAPSITRTTSTLSSQSSNLSTKSNSSAVPKTKNPDFSTLPRSSAELQMRNPDFSRSFIKSSPSPANLHVTPSNFPEIVKKNNYISDLQLKPPTTPSNQHPLPNQLVVHSSSSYKIDYRPPQMSSQSPSYPNIKKESIYNYNNQHSIDEPLAHVISKNQFNPIDSKDHHQIWNDAQKGEKLLGGSSQYDQTPFEHKIPLQEKSNQFNSNEDLRKFHPAHYPHPSHSRDERNEFSLKQKEQQLRQEGTIITIKNEAATKTIEIPERRSADLFRDYKLKQSKESPDTVAASPKQMIEPPPLAYHQQYPDFPANYPRFSKSTENMSIKSNPSPIPMQHEQFTPAMRNYHTPSPSTQQMHRQPKSPLTIPLGPSLMNPPQNWVQPPPLVLQSRHSASPAASTHMQPGPSHHSSPPNYYSSHSNAKLHPSSSSSRSPSQSPILNPMHPSFYGTSPQHKLSNQYYKYSESINKNDFKDSPQNSNYYHLKQPDFSRRFENEKNFIVPDTHENRSFIPIENRIPLEISNQSLPVRHDLEIKTIRHSSQEMSHQNMYHRPIDAQYYPRQNEMRSRPTQESSHVREFHDRSRIPPDLKIEKRNEDVKSYPVPVRRQMPPPEAIPELSIIPKIKAEPPQALVQREMPTTSNIIKSTKSLLTEVKRESPLDLSVKTVKTKADSTGCDQDFQLRHHSEPSSLKVEFSPNFGNVSKTDCRQQARLGPQAHSIQRTIHVGVDRPSASLRYPEKEHQQPVHSNAAHLFRTHPNQPPPHVIPPNNKGYPQKYPTANDMERPHAPVPTVSEYYNHKQSPSQKTVQRPHQPGPSSSHRFESNYHPESPQNTSRGYSFPPVPQSVQYPVINKPSHVGNSMNAKYNPAINPKDPIFLEKERDRKYVEEILYGRTRNPHSEQQQTSRHYPNPSPPRKRHLEASQHVFGSVPPAKQGRIEDVTPFVDLRFSHPYIDPHKVGTPPNLVRHENYQQASSMPINNNNANSNNNNNINKQYPDPRKDAIKSVEMMAHSNPSNSSYYPNPKAEMIYRSDPSAANKFYYKDVPTYQHNQNFQHRPDDGIFPNNSRVAPHPISQPENNVIKLEQQQTTGPMSELQQLSGDKPFNGLVLPPALSGSNGNIPRGAEQSTIQKLKSNLELREQQKLKIENDRHHHPAQKKDLSPRQFRTKAEMKGYTPLPVNVGSNGASINSPSSSNINAPSAFDLLDWGSACNDFVQQLQTGNKKKATLRKKRHVKSDEKSPTVSVPGTACSDLSQVPKEILNSINKAECASSSDEDKPLQELKRNLSQQDLSDKLSRNFRENRRQEIEQKYAARLGRPSSSESETDIRKGLRGIKRVRRLRKRAAVGIKHDDEHSKEEGAHSGETDDDVHHKKKHSKSTSKLDDLTSSDEEIEKKKPTVNTSGNNTKKVEESKKKVVNNSKKPSTLTPDIKQISPSNAAIKKESSSESSESTSGEEELTTEDIINKLSERKNQKKLKDLGDKSNIKNLLEEGETMTRSKRKLENEKKLSNSKILRNEKVVQNKVVARGGDKKANVAQQSCNNKNKSLSPLKRKDLKADEIKRKIPESESDEGNKLKNKKQRKSSKVEEHSSDNISEAEEEIKAERLRPRKPKIEPATTEVLTKAARKKVEDENTPMTSSGTTSDAKQERKSLADLFAHSEDKSSKFTPGWEMETYNFKRSLKIPPGLITIGRPLQHGISHSLPDLDPQTSDTSEIFSEFVKSKDKEGSKKTPIPKSKTKSATKQVEKKPSSIIDLLHHRVMQSKKKSQTKKKAVTNATAPAKSANESESLLPTPEKESEKIFGVKKNIFETFVLTSRTRTENNTMRKKEILKEVFGADEDRPRSAPPSGDTLEGDKNISYDQKFREYLEKMNVDFLDAKKPETSGKFDAIVKDEEEDFDDNETIAASEKSTNVSTPLGKGKIKKNRPRRSKGSSGFDYIRKKKKPTPNTNSENPMNVNNIIKKRLAAMESLETKDENDICKEIKGWVRNKSVGESILHKASRLNYVDVVAYCLDRLNMDPNTKDNAGYTPLHEACSRGHLEIARLLLQFGANHSETALSGIRPLHEAIENGHIEIVRLLLSYGADPCLATYSGQLPIQMAEDKEMEDFLQSYLDDIKEGIKASWFFEGAFKIDDPDEIGYDVFDDVPINKTDLGSSIASVFSTSMTSLITATTQMSDNETVISETTATSTPMKTPIMKAPSQDLIKYQHKMKKCDTNSNNLVMSDTNNGSIAEGKQEKIVKRTKDCSVILNNIDSTMKKIKKLPAIAKTDSPMIIKAHTTEVIQKLNEIKHKEDYDDMMADENVESDCEFLEVEESEAPLPPLYLLKDEGTDKWMLLTDLCTLLKVKSRDSVLKQICPSSPPSANKELIREMKLTEFLERATCLQLFCAGEKLNVRASKVSLVRYNESVKNLLGVQTFKLGMNM